MGTVALFLAAFLFVACVTIHQERTRRYWAGQWRENTIRVLADGTPEERERLHRYCSEEYAEG
ncbi:MAG TPA: hypothetical protein PLP17_12570, partial [Oligoflexia bacterium]|nr:hypothetical protein [Oligoflexia bacterium]